MEIARGEAQQRDAQQADLEIRFARLRPRLTAICAAVVGTDDAADLVQETWLRATERLHQLRDPDLLEAWLVRIALNESRSFQRRRRLERSAVVTRPLPTAPDLALRQLVERLEPRERAVIVLHYAYGFRMGEVGRLLGLSEINVRTIAHLARRTLRAQLEEKDR